MKPLIKWILVPLLILALLGSATAAMAQDDSPSPANPDRLRGKVTAIEGEVIVIENLAGSQRITTNAETRFRLGRAEAGLADIEVGNFVLSRGVKQDDGTFVARVVIAVTPEQLRRHVLRGKVTSVDTSAGTLTVEAKGNKAGLWTISTTVETRYRIPGVTDPTLADIAAGSQVIVLGQQAEDGSQSGTARFIGALPAGVEGSVRLRGEVTAVNGATFSLQTPRRGEVTIVTDDSTQYFTRRDQTVSLADISVGVKVIILGEPVEDQEATIQAKLVGLRPK